MRGSVLAVRASQHHARVIWNVLRENRLRPKAMFTNMKFQSVWAKRNVDQAHPFGPHLTFAWRKANDRSRSKAPSQIFPERTLESEAPIIFS